MIIKRLQLRGAKGIKYGLGLSEIDIDFTKLHPGLVAIVGYNGSGKTTLLENLTPFRSLFSRSGKLQNHFFLPDSHRILTFELGGSTYVATILVDPEKDKTVASLTCDGEPIAAKSREYDTEIDSIFLSKTLFEQSLFFGQDTNRITDLRAGEAKEFMIKLLRLDAADSIQKRSRIYMNDAINTYNHTSAMIRDIEELLRDKEIDTNALLAKRLQLDDIKKSMQLKKVLLEDAKIQFIHKEKKDQCEKKLFEYKKDIQVEKLQQENNDREYKQLIQDNNSEQIQLRIKQLQDDIKDSLFNEEDHKLLSNFIIREQEHKERNSKIQNKLNETRTLLNEQQELERIETTELERSIANIKSNISHAIELSSKIDDTPCDDVLGEQCNLLQSAYEAKRKIENLEKQLKEEQANLIEINKKFSDIKDIKVRIQRLEEMKNTIEIDLINIQKQIDPIKDMNKYKEDLNLLNSTLIQVQTQLENAEALTQQVLVTYERTKEQIMQRIMSIKEKEQKTQRQLNELKVYDFVSIEEKIVNFDIDIKELENNKDIVTLKIGQLEQKVNTFEEAEQRIRKLRKKLRMDTVHQKEWAIIEQAFGKNGLQAFEIKESLPAIVTMMNELLVGSLGQKFTLNFRMKREGSQGQLIDTFDPLVTRYSGEEILEDNVPLNDLSRGERILIFVAMCEAVGVFMRNSIGLDLRTAFVDEADGPLDPANRSDYLQTRLHVHQICDLHHTFIISQSTDIHERISQKLILGDGKVEMIT